MSILDSLLLFKLVILAGLALWATLGFFNNISAFATGVAALGRMMTMQLLDQEPPVKTPLQSRKVASPRWHKLGFTAVIVLELIAGALLWYAVAGFAGALTGATEIANAVVRANLALTAFVVLGFFLILGGQWFVYYIRQEGLHTLHFVLVAVSIATAILINVR